MAIQRLIEYLDGEGIQYRTDEHPVAYTAQEVAATEHVTGWQVAKPVILDADGELVMVVLPAPMRVDLDRAPSALGTSSVRLAAEGRFSEAFEDCEPGAEPPFGNLYGIPVYLDRSLLDQEEIVFRDGTHQGTVAMATADYLRLVEPVEVEVGEPTDEG